MKVTTNHHSIRLLVVDDERLIADTLKMILDNSGYETRVAYSGESAVEMARDFQPDMLITDVIMPGMTGIEAAILLLTTLPSCKVLLVSGHMATTELIEEARLQNYQFEVLAKPFHPGELITKLRSAMSGGQALCSDGANRVPLE
jgi:CheY-like chemotaxis protein